MIPKNKSQKGQALILIALSIFGIIGLIALAVDGGNAFADRRQAQNAADAAALAASMRYAQDQTLANSYFTNLVIATTSSDGYTNTAPRSTVVLTKSPSAEGDCPQSTDGLYFQVDIDSTMPTWFGAVVGVSQVHNHVTSKALSCPPTYEAPYGGNAIVALNKTVCRALEIGGSSQTKVTSSTGQGIFVNSSCKDVPTSPQNALYGGSGSVSAPAVSVVGGVYGADIFLPTVVQTGVPQITKQYIWPTISAAECGGTATIAAGQPDTLNPGVFPGNNNTWKTKDFPPAGITKLNPGIYCLDNDFKTTGGNVLDGNGVLIVQRSGIISIQGGAITLSASQSEPYRGLLFYMPISNSGGSISINGSGASTYNGSIVAPGAHASLNGGGDTDGPFRTQIIADTISLGGNGTLDIYYDAESQYRPPLSAGIQLLK